MGTLSATLGKKANAPLGKAGSKNPEMGATNQLLIECMRALAPRKTWAKLVELTQLPDRIARHRIEGDRKFSTDELRLLLQSEAGLYFLSALMADAQPKWWVRIQAYLKANDARRAVAKHQRELQEAMNHVSALASDIARAEAAAPFCDEEFLRPDLDARIAVAGPAYRAVARPRR